MQLLMLVGKRHASSGSRRSCAGGNGGVLGLNRTAEEVFDAKEDIIV
jgi:hypothetical protein